MKKQKVGQTSPRNQPNVAPNSAQFGRSLARFGPNRSILLQCGRILVKFGKSRATLVGWSVGRVAGRLGGWPAGGGPDGRADPGTHAGHRIACPECVSRVHAPGAPTPVPSLSVVPMDLRSTTSEGSGAGNHTAAASPQVVPARVEAAPKDDPSSEEEELSRWLACARCPNPGQIRPSSG